MLGPPNAEPGLVGVGEPAVKVSADTSVTDCGGVDDSKCNTGLT
jgi:hypothetical protein